MGTSSRPQNRYRREPWNMGLVGNISSFHTDEVTAPDNNREHFIPVFYSILSWKLASNILNPNNKCKCQTLPCRMRPSLSQSPPLSQPSHFPLIQKTWGQALNLSSDPNATSGGRCRCVCRRSLGRLTISQLPWLVSCTCCDWYFSSPFF
jgi:hypothetical protein